MKCLFAFSANGPASFQSAEGTEGTEGPRAEGSEGLKRVAAALLWVYLIHAYPCLSMPVHAYQ